MEDQVFTQDQVNEQLEAERAKLESEVIKPLQDELLKYKPVQKSDAELALEEKQSELWQREMSLSLKEAGLSEFAEFINANDADDLKVKIARLLEILKQKEVTNSFKPLEHKQTVDKYSRYEKEKNVTGMLSEKLSKLFN